MIVVALGDHIYKIHSMSKLWEATNALVFLEILGSLPPICDPQ